MVFQHSLPRNNHLLGTETIIHENLLDKSYEFPIKTTCIITDKVFASYHQKVCFENIKVSLQDKEFEDIVFNPGFIVKDSYKIDYIDEKPNFKRIRFILSIPHYIKTKRGININGYLPDIQEDIVLFIPKSRNEFDFDIVVETCTKLLKEIKVCSDVLTFSVESFIIIKVVGKVQLLIPAMDFNLEPPICEPFEYEKNICDIFNNKPFPCFYPPKYEDLFKTICVRFDIPIRKMNRIVIYGQITDCENNKPIKGATVGVFIGNEFCKSNLICHTYSGIDGYYMISIPSKYEGQTISIMAVKNDDSNNIKPCKCKLFN